MSMAKLPLNTAKLDFSLLLPHSVTSERVKKFGKPENIESGFVTKDGMLRIVAQFFRNPDFPYFFHAGSRKPNFTKIY